MDEAMKQQLQQMLSDLLKNANDAAIWAKGEIPLLIQEKIAFERAFQTFLLLAFLLIGYLLMRGWFRWWKWKPNDEDGMIFTAVFLGVSSLIIIICTLTQMRDVMMVWFAPRLYIVEWLVSMVK